MDNSLPLRYSEAKQSSNHCFYLKSTMKTEITLQLLDKLDHLKKEQFDRFKMLLQSKNFKAYKLEMASRTDTVSMLMEVYTPDDALKVTNEIISHLAQPQPRQEMDHRTENCQRKLKLNLQMMFTNIFEGIPEAGSAIYLNEIYTELYITEGESENIYTEHEVIQVESSSRNLDCKSETRINCQDIFNPVSGKAKLIKTVMTKGVAGIGKTVCVQKFILDWAEGKANLDVHFIFPLPFRELNLRENEKLSFKDLIHDFFEEIEDIHDLCNKKVLFILDGLDECRLPLNFAANISFSDVRKPASLDVLLTNLIRRTIFPSALLWITSRPAAVKQIPANFVDQVTEVRGFDDSQKEVYFTKKFRDNKTLAQRIIRHIKTSRSLHIMCHMPVFCWISASVLQHLFSHDSDREFPKTLTEMFTLFLLFQIKRKNAKYLEERAMMEELWTDDDIKSIQSLGKLAFLQLEKGNLIFYEKDLMECDINVDEANVYQCGVFTKIFRKVKCMQNTTLFCFVHLSVQEFLAALYAIFLFLKHNENVFLQSRSNRSKPVSMLLKCAVDKALESQNGHLDLFLRFLMGLTLECNQTNLQGLLTQKKNSLKSHNETVEHIRNKIRGKLSSERCINLFHCLNELNDHSLVAEIQRYLESGNLHKEKLQNGQWSALAFVLLTSEKGLEDFDLRQYSKSEDGLMKLLPVIKASTNVIVSGCGITEKGCGSLVSALKRSPSPLRVLDLSSNTYGNVGINWLSDGLKDPNCRLATLRMSFSLITEEGCSYLVSALNSNPSHLRELDLSKNMLRDSGIKHLCHLLAHPLCKWEILRLAGCLVTEEGCASLASALASNPLHLKHLDLSANDLGVLGVRQMLPYLGHLKSLRLYQCGLTPKCCYELIPVLESPSSELTELDLGDNELLDAGVMLLSVALSNSNCKLVTLRLSGCLVTEVGCAFLATALKANPSHLRELDLSYNHPGLRIGRNLLLKLQDLRLNMDHCGEWRIKVGPKKYACKLTFDPNNVGAELSFSEENRKVAWTTEGSERKFDPGNLSPHVLCPEALSGRCYWELEWGGDGPEVGVTYTPRRDSNQRFALGENAYSWALDCGDSIGKYIVKHRKEEINVEFPSALPRRVGVHLDWPAGTVAFYTVLSDTRTRLYTYWCTFDAPLYAAIYVHTKTSFVSLC